MRWTTRAGPIGTVPESRRRSSSPLATAQHTPFAGVLHGARSYAAVARRRRTIAVGSATAGLDMVSEPPPKQHLQQHLRVSTDIPVWATLAANPARRQGQWPTRPWRRPSN